MSAKELQGSAGCRDVYFIFNGNIAALFLFKIPRPFF